MTGENYSIERALLNWDETNITSRKQKAVSFACFVYQHWEIIIFKKQLVFALGTCYFWVRELSAAFRGVKPLYTFKKKSLASIKL